MKTNFKHLIALTFFTLFFISCSKSDSASSSSGGGITVSGLVVDESNMPISGAQVKSGEILGTTNSNGEFTLTNVPYQERTVVEIIAMGFFDGYRGFTAISGQTQKLNVMMESKGTPTNFSATSGTSLLNQGGTVVIAPNTVMDATGNAYSGNVTAYLRFHNPSQTNFSKIMQGGDFAGQNTSGETGILSSSGFYSVEMEDNSGNKLNIKTGSTASFSLPIASAQVASAATTIKLWSFDKTKGMWVEEGTATKSGSKYIGEVSHFSQWNCDHFSLFFNVVGRIVCNGNGISKYITITDAINGGQLYTTSGSNGNFSIRVPQGNPVTLSIEGYAPVIDISAQNSAQDYSVGTIEICSTSNPNSTLTQVLISRPWTGNACFNTEIGVDNANIYTFHANNTVSVTPTDPLYIPYTWSISNANILVLTFGETQFNGDIVTCTERWTIDSFTASQLTLNRTVTDCTDTFTTSCDPILIGQ